MIREEQPIEPVFTQQQGMEIKMSNNETKAPNAIIEIWQPVDGKSETLMAEAKFHWDVRKCWLVFVSEIAEIADKMLMENDPHENAYINMRFTTKESY
jgi:hypothetical protein